MVLTRTQRARMMARMVTNRQEVEGVDRISELPDVLLYYIFSFIDTIYMVKSCVLSKRFQNLWRSLTVFQFHERNYPNYIFFITFVRNVLSHRIISNIYSFSLECILSVDPRSLKFVLHHVLLHGTKHLTLKLGLCDYCFSLYPVFAYQSFETLYAPCSVLYPWNTYNFPVITTLDLHNPTFHDLSRLDEPFSGCPNLKNLTLHNCKVDLDVLSIKGEHLQKLDISFKPCPRPFVLVIQGPKLYSLKYKGDAFFKVSANVPLIEKVDLSCFFHYDGNDEERDRNIIELLQEFQHSKYLKLGLGIVEVMVSCAILHQTRLRLSNLKLLELSLSIEYYGMSRIISYLLGNFPAKALVWKNLWKDVLYSRERQVETCLIGQQHYRIKLVMKDILLQIKVNYQLTQEWSPMFSRCES